MQQNTNPLAQYDVSDNVYNTYTTNIIPKAAKEAFWKGAVTSFTASAISGDPYIAQLGGMFTGYKTGYQKGNEIASTVFRDIFISEEAEGALKTNLSHNTLAASTIGATMGNIVGIVAHNTIIGSSDRSANDRGF